MTNGRVHSWLHHHLVLVMSVMINTNKHTPAFSAVLHVSPVAVAFGHSQVAFGDRAALCTNTDTSVLAQGAVW